MFLFTTELEWTRLELGSKSSFQIELNQVRAWTIEFNLNSSFEYQSQTELDRLESGIITRTRVWVWYMSKYIPPVLDQEVRIYRSLLLSNRRCCVTLDSFVFYAQVLTWRTLLKFICFDNSLRLWLPDFHVIVSDDLIIKSTFGVESIHRSIC